ncbi:MAG: phosphate ABC transporter substrate-binding protein [Treponema sp.]|jgi:phosphate transport system substrate-binding protein|nr:phosphate ABC transporter substrate-binding protein [Treponema sp.]
MKTKIIVVLMAVLVLASGCRRGSGLQGSSDESYTIEIGGSTSVTPVMEALQAEYANVRPNVRINISGTGSGDGINNAGITYQIGMSSRDLTPAEQGRGLRTEVIAIDGIAVIVNRDNAVSNLSLEQIYGIYTGSITNWNQVGGRNATIAVVSREEGSGTRGAFEELAGFQGRLLGGANQLTSTGAILANISQNQDAIGYISLGSVNDSIKAISVGGVAPTVENVTRGTYKIARPFIVLTGNNVHLESASFVQWILSSAGQTIVTNRGYITPR